MTADAPKKGFLLRLDPAVHQALQGWAQDEHRSLNGHLEFVLTQALEGAGRAPKKPADARPRKDTAL